MSKTIKLKKGFDLNLVGKPALKLGEVEQSETFAIKPTDFIGISRPKLLVKEGDSVKAGTPLMFDKYAEDVKFVSPVSGEVIEIKRGEKRKLLEIKILADKEIAFEDLGKVTISDIASMSREDVVKEMSQRGVWTQLIQRPFGMVADTAVTPKSIFISGFDSHPLAPDMDFVLKGEEQNLQAGLDAIKKLTTGTVHFNLNGAGEMPKVFSQLDGVQINKFNGKHPAGNVGTQIHHLDPINKGDIVWTLSPFAVAQIGKVFLEGKYDSSRIIALTGSEVNEPQYVKVHMGTCLNKIAAKFVKTGNNRFISGNVLTGTNVGKDGYLGYFDHQITVIPEGDEEEFLGWLLPSTSKLSFHKAIGLLGFLNPSKERLVDTNTHGEKRQFVVTGALEDVMPMDILPTYLFKSIIANDYDEMEALGIYELIEEDVALCEFIDVSKNDIQGILREGIEMIRNS